MKQRIAEITEGLRSIQDAWPFLRASVDARIAELTRSLVNTNNEETRGRIKALLEFKELPETLDQEREGLIAALSEEDAAPE